MSRSNIGLGPVHQAHIARLRALEVSIDEDGLRLGDTYTMFFVERGLMRATAELLTESANSCDVLDVGLGLGIFAEACLTLGIGSYTAVEPHAGVVSAVVPRLEIDDTQVTIHVAPWQSVDFQWVKFDCILLDTWPPPSHADSDFDQFLKQVVVPHLRPGGRFSFFNSGAEISPARLQALSESGMRVALHDFEIGEELLPPSWTKPTGRFVIPVCEVSS